MEPRTLFDELAFLTGLDAPSGFEEPVVRYVRERLEKVTDETTVDIRGNLFARKEGSDKDAPLVMVMAHADEVGFMVRHITAGGFLRFVKIGGPTDMVLAGRRVRVLGENGPLDGVIGVKPGHVLSGGEARKVPPIEEMYIDIGAESAEEASRWGVETGTPVVFSGELAPTRHPSRVFGKAVDDRAGVLAMVRAAEALHGGPVAPTVVWCLSVEEEIGLRGAAVAALDVRPDVVIALDTCPAGGTPDLQPDELPWRIGGGPLIKIRETRGLSTHRPLREMLRGVAEKNGIPYQLIVDTAGMTDASAAQQAGGRIASASLGIPRRYSHSAVEMLDLDDLRNLIALLAAAIPEMRDRKDLMRI